MKVLMISTVPFRKNGISKVILNIANCINKKCYQIDLVSINMPDKDSLREIKKAGCKLFYIPRTKGNLLGYFIQLSNLIKRYDTVHVHTNSGTCLVELLACKIGNCTNIVLHGHNTSCKYMALHKILKPIINSFKIKRVACSSEAGEFLFGGKNFLVFNNAIDVDTYRFDSNKRESLRHELGISDDEIVIGHVGVFNYQKNHEFLIKAFNEYHRKVKSKLILVGDGVLKDEISSLVNKLRLDRDVICVGNVNNVEAFLFAMDYFVFPSRYEGLGIALVEAQASGLMCFASDTVPREANAGGTITFLPLSHSPAYWSNCIPVIQDCERNTTSSVAIVNIRKNGYEMHTVINKLVNLYR